jgi:hypothetical protein
MKKAKKEKFPRFKVWVEIERLTKDGDEDSNYIAPMPDCVGTADTEKGAMAIQFNIAMQNGIDPENSDCRPRAKRSKKCPACKRQVTTCACIPVGDEQELSS